MNPEIREFPSDAFYDGILTDSGDILARENKNYFQTHYSNMQKSPRVVFYDIVFSREGTADGRPSKLN